VREQAVGSKGSRQETCCQVSAVVHGGRGGARSGCGGPVFNGFGKKDVDRSGGVRSDFWGLGIQLVERSRHLAPVPLCLPPEPDAAHVPAHGAPIPDAGGGTRPKCPPVHPAGPRRRPVSVELARRWRVTGCQSLGSSCP
jgi:hypothetical protein